MGRGKNKVLSAVVRETTSDIDSYRQHVRTHAPRIAELGQWPGYIDPIASLVGRVPTQTLPASGFDAGIACALDLIPRPRQYLSACLHAAYTPAAIELVREQSQHLQADSETCWWLAACSVCKEAALTEEEFEQQVRDFKVLAADAVLRLQAASACFQSMIESFRLEDGIAFGTVDGAMQGAYVAGHDLAVVHDEKTDLYFVGTFHESLGLEDFAWSQSVDERGRPRSGGVYGSQQFVKAADASEYQLVLAALRKNGRLQP
jgi:hypothetical protein